MNTILWKEETLSFRLEQESDYRVGEELTREAFWNKYLPGATEHCVLHSLRKSEDFIKELDIVAEQDGKLVGNIVYTLATILDKENKKSEVLMFGPFSILPNFQNKGLGTKLLKFSLQRAKQLGYKAVAIYGDYNFYSKFGFKPGKQYRVSTADEIYHPALLVLELEEGALQGIHGRLIESPAFAVSEEEVNAFDKKFPPKEKLETESQKLFLKIMMSGEKVED